MPSSVRARLRRLVAIVLAVSMVGVAAPAGADPSSDEVRSRLQRAEDRLDEIEEQVSAAVEDYNEAQVALEAATQEREDAEAELAVLTADAQALLDVVAEHARRLHKLGPTVELSSIFVAADPTEAGARLAVLRRVLDGQRADLEGLDALRTAQAATEERLAAAEADAEQRAAEVEQRRAAMEATLSEHQDEVARLQAELQEAIEREEAERRRLEEERRRREAERRRQQEAERERQAELARAERRGQAEREEQAAQGTERVAEQEQQSTAPAPTTRKSAQVAVDTALAQLGKPYRWGGSGPDAFDCSGLTSFAWRAAGVELPRTSRAQYAATTRISRDQLQPGDLVFYHSPISHVAMYIGGTKVVEAPFSGNNVRIRHDGLTRSGIVGYGRP